MMRDTFIPAVGTRRVRRRAVLAAGALGSAGLLAAACSAKSKSSSGVAARSGAVVTATPAARRGGVLRAGEPFDLLLALGGGGPIAQTSGNWYVVYPVLEQLVRYRQSLEPELVLVDQFEYNADHTKLVARLKPNLTYHNGASVTPEDVFFGVDFVANPQKYGAVGASNIAFFAQAITAMTKLDDRTMAFTFDKPRPNMTDMFAQLQITPAAGFDDLRTGKAIIGTGPYRFTNWKPKESYRLEANHSWHGTAKEGGPYLDAIDVTIFADDDARRLAFEAGNLDLVLRAPASLARSYTKSNQVPVTPKVGLSYAGVVTDNPVLSDPRVRQALFLAIDRKRIADELLEGLGGAVTTQPWPSTSPAYDPSLDAPFYDPSRAMALLRSAGFSQQQPVLLETYPGTDALAQLVQQNLAAIGVKVEIRQLDLPAWNTKFLERKFTDLFFAGHSYAHMSPLTTLQQAYPYKLVNPSHYESKDYADLVSSLEALDSTSEAAKAQYARFNKLFHDDAWMIPLNANVGIDLQSPNVTGFDEYFIAIHWSLNFGKLGLKA
jgi:peptide/nickel transport system substrate-binding protein